jgi:signal transduction histidine kinase/phage shock protein PspC (stress-responsive transcriptional regulator)
MGGAAAVCDHALVQEQQSSSGPPVPAGPATAVGNPASGTGGVPAPAQPPAGGQGRGGTAAAGRGSWPDGGPAAARGTSAPGGRDASTWGLYTRSRDDRVLAGVAGGLAERFGVDPVLVRVGLVVLASAAGAGIVLYLLGWVLSSEPAPDAPPPRRPRPASLVQSIAFACVLAGGLLILRTTGLWLSDALTWPLALAGVGSAVLWATGDAQDRARWSGLASRPLGALFGSRGALWRVTTGGVLVVAGFGAFLASGRGVTIAALGPVLAAVAITAVGLGILLGPWGWRLARQLSEERVERARSQERAELAAHLHDSVLQTLALIQRSDDPREIRTLARTQERDLRAWLYGTNGVAGTLRAAAQHAAADVEARHRVPVEVVVVGDAALDEQLQALVQAATEAMHNAARHSGADRVSLYVEVEEATVTAFVTDQGRGFDPERLPPGRLGITESIRGRMARHGGEASVLSEPGEGTEVALRVARGGIVR